jgi:hypothetical protein
MDYQGIGLTGLNTVNGTVQPVPIVDTVPGGYVMVGTNHNPTQCGDGPLTPGALSIESRFRVAVCLSASIARLGAG